MKKLLFIALVSIFVFTGCSLTDQIAEKAAEKAIEAGTGAEVDLEDGTITAESDGQTISIGEDVKLPSDFPSDVPVYSKAQVVSSFSSDEAHTATLTSSKDFDTVKSYYQKEIESEGWTINSTSNLNLGGQSTTFLCTKDGRNLTVGIYAYEESEEVTISLTVD